MKPSILIVDDEFGLAELVAELLTEEGFEAVIAINGRLGLERLGRQRASLVILDVMMPVMSGPEMARAMRSNPEFADIPIVMMTSLASLLPVDDPPIYEAFLRKPFPPDDLFDVVKRLLGQGQKSS
jgi:CheY-like chemotaxis protein